MSRAKYTTIRIRNETRKKLKIIKAEMDMETYDDVLNYLISLLEKRSKKEVKQP